MTLEIDKVSKHFGNVYANNNVSLSIGSGEIHGLLGENGAGKSTLVKILSGFFEKEAGEIRLDGQLLDLSSPKDSIDYGIGILHQEPMVFLPFSVLDNFLIGSTDQFVTPRKEALKQFQQICHKFDFDLDPEISVSLLTIGQRQQLEIARLLWLDPKVLIFDEPTNAISPVQREKLFTTIRQLATEGMLVIFVSHKLEEIAAICDSVTVLRKGEVAGSKKLPCPESELIELMFGKIFPSKKVEDIQKGGIQLTISNLKSTEGREYIEIANFQIRQSEIVGIAGIEGAGQRTFLRAIAGRNSPESGTIVLGQNLLDKTNYHQRLEDGMYYMPADRLGEGLVSELTITEHIALVESKKKNQIIDWEMSYLRANELITQFQIQGTPESKAESLSGGNQQRLMFALMPRDANIILLEHPTRGLDIESADWIWNQLLDMRSDDCSIIFSSSDFEELLSYSDKIIVCFAGQIAGEFEKNEFNPEHIASLMSGIQI
tara:strand:+ start:3039 stop:4505 length:1467 start_codon:yes stop_codon:yes gene_type:complete